MECKLDDVTETTNGETTVPDVARVNTKDDETKGGSSSTTISIVEDTSCCSAHQAEDLAEIETKPSETEATSTTCEAKHGMTHLQQAGNEETTTAEQQQQQQQQHFESIQAEQTLDTTEYTTLPIQTIARISNDSSTVEDGSIDDARMENDNSTKPSGSPLTTSNHPLETPETVTEKTPSQTADDEDDHSNDDEPETIKASADIESPTDEKEDGIQNDGTSVDDDDDDDENSSRNQVDSTPSSSNDNNNSNSNNDEVQDPETQSAEVPMDVRSSSSTSSNSSYSSSSFEDPLVLTFCDFLDLQTRLVLLPSVEAEGTGAVVASYPQDDDGFGGLALKSINDIDVCADAYFEDLLVALREASIPIRLRFCEPQEGENTTTSSSSNNTLLIHEEKKDDEYRQSTTTIPARVEITATTTSYQRHGSPSKEQRNTTAIGLAMEGHPATTTYNNNNAKTTLSSGMMALSGWGMRMKAHSEKILAAAAAAKNETAQPKTPPPQETRRAHKPILSRPPCDIYVQSNLGAYFLVSSTNTNNTTALDAKASSLFCIRKSATEACGSDDESVKYAFQWYHSLSTQPYNKESSDTPDSLGDGGDDDASAASWSSDGGGSSSVSSSSSYSGTCSSCFVSDMANGSGNGHDNNKWILLEGATGPTFRANTTLVGKRLRCVVVVRSTEDDSDESSNTDHNDEEVDGNDVSRLDDETVDNRYDPLHAPLNKNEERFLCDSVAVISADPILFNAAKQVFVDGEVARFGNLVGRSCSSDAARGKIFKIEVGTARSVDVAQKDDDDFGQQQSPKKNDHKPRRRRVMTVNSLFIYGKDTPHDDYRPLSDTPLLRVTAKASPTNPKHVDLFFPSIPTTRPETQSFLSDYCVVAAGDGIPRLALETPDRTTRESLLLALGIANHPGKVSRLDNKTVLFREDDDDDDCSNDCDALAVHSLSSRMESKNILQTNNTTKDNQSSSSTPQQKLQQPVLEIPTASHARFPSEDNTNHTSDVPSLVQELQREMDTLRAQLSLKNKTVTDLERRLQASETAQQEANQGLVDARRELQNCRQDCQRIQASKRHLERSMQVEFEERQRFERDHEMKLQGVETKLAKSAETIAELEKVNRGLQNKNAVLGATVEVRESKLVKLEELQTSNHELSQKIARQEKLLLELDNCHKKNKILQNDYDATVAAEADSRKELEATRHTVETMRTRIMGEQEKASACQSRLEAIRKTNQQLMGERNNLKQKNESLSKEVSRLCRGGRSLRDIEKILADHESLLQETEVLRAQKKKAIEDAHKYRTSYEQAKAAEELLSTGMDDRETRQALERTKELERLLSELTDYVSAKEQQLDTMKQVNEALQEEIHGLAKANLRRDEV